MPLLREREPSISFSDNKKKLETAIERQRDILFVKARLETLQHHRDDIIAEANSQREIQDKLRGIGVEERLLKEQLKKLERKPFDHSLEDTVPLDGEKDDEAA